MAQHERLQNHWENEEQDSSYKITEGNTVQEIEK